MPKLKTHKGSKKVFKKRKNDYKIGQKRNASSLSKADQNRLKNII